jgi:F0F1-type ATP synthase assembly protein I
MPVGKEAYKRIKIAGMISFIPIALAAGPLSGYVVGRYLEKKFSIGPAVIFISVIIGFIAGITETTRIIKLVSKIDTNPRNMGN